jgi:hypothetical protein
MADVLSIGVKAGGKRYPAGTSLDEIDAEALTDEDRERLSHYEVDEAEQEEFAHNFDREPGAALSTQRSEHNMELTVEHEAGDYADGATSEDGGKEENPSVGNALTEEPGERPEVPEEPPVDVAADVNPDDFTRDQLVTMAEGLGLSVPGGATKQEIADLINEANAE